MLESAEKDIKRIITTVLHLFKMFDRDLEDTTSLATPESKNLRSKSGESCIRPLLYKTLLKKLKASKMEGYVLFMKNSTY